MRFCMGMTFLEAHGAAAFGLGIAGGICCIQGESERLQREELER
jgi:hypothetical protein